MDKRIIQHSVINIVSVVKDGYAIEEVLTESTMRWLGSG